MLSWDKRRHASRIILLISLSLLLSGCRKPGVTSPEVDEKYQEIGASQLESYLGAISTDDRYIALLDDSSDLSVYDLDCAKEVFINVTSRRVLKHDSTVRWVLFQEGDSIVSSDGYNLYEWSASDFRLRKKISVDSLLSSNLEMANLGAVTHSGKIMLGGMMFGLYLLKSDPLQLIDGPSTSGKGNLLSSIKTAKGPAIDAGVVFETPSGTRAFAVGEDLKLKPLPAHPSLYAVWISDQGEVNGLSKDGELSVVSDGKWVTRGSIPVSSTGVVYCSLGKDTLAVSDGREAWLVSGSTSSLLWRSGRGRGVTALSLNTQKGLISCSVDGKIKLVYTR